MSDFPEMMLDVAKLIWGDPHKVTPNEVRFGQGRTVNPSEGVWYIHDQEKGGGVLHLIEAELHLKGREAFDWLRDHNFDVPTPNGRSNVIPMNANSNRIVATYDYTDTEGTLVYQVLRMEPKEFRQRRPNGNGGWIGNLNGVTPSLYRLAELMAAIKAGLTVFVVEGEKCVDALEAEGVPATCNSGGAGKFPAHMVEIFRGADVVVLPDNDKPGKSHGDKVLALLQPVAKRARRLELPDLPPKGDVVDWLKAGGDVRKLIALAKEQPVVTEIPYDSPLGAIRFKDIDTATGVHKWLIQGVLTAGERALVVGPSGSGKTFVALDLALAVARGEDWQGKRVEQGLVLYQAGEGGKGLVKRVKAYRDYNGRIHPALDLPFVLLPSRIDLYKDDDSANLLIAEANHFKGVYPDFPLKLIVIDTFSTATPGADENSGKDVGRVLDRAALIGEQTGAAVLIVHHMNAEGNKPRGHTSIFANVDSVLLCTKSEDKDADKRFIRDIDLIKQKDADDGSKWRYVLKGVTVGTDEYGEPIISCVCEEPGDGVIEVHDYEGMNPSAKSVFNGIRGAMGKYGKPRESAPDVPFTVPRSIAEVLAKSDLADYMHSHYGVSKKDETEADRKREAANIRQVLKRGFEDLERGGYIGLSDKHLWMTGKQPPVSSRPILKRKK